MTREDIIDHIESLYTQSAILKQVSVIKEPRLTDGQLKHLIDELRAFKFNISLFSDSNSSRQSEF